MASNVIDLISSSPPRDVVHPQKQAAAKPDNGAFGLPHIEIQSDDFCSSGDDIFDGSQLDDEHSAKRPRLSLDRADDQQCRPSASSTVKPSCHGDGQSSKTASRDIEFISSFGSQTLASPKPRTTSLKRSRTEPPLPSSDPFASSPPKPRATTTSVAARAAQDLSSDPFASPSPIRGVAPHRTANTALAQGSENTQLARYPSSDPFATSSPVRIIASTRAPNPTLAREPTRQKRTAAAWDPISSLAPCSSAPPKVADIPSNRSSRSPSIISIGDSSASSDDELPAISNFDLPQGQSSRYSYLSTSAPKASSTTKSRRKVSDPQPQKARQTVDPAQRAAAAALKKQQKRDERERAKEERQRERDVAAAIVEVNKAKGNRKVSTREMIVEIPSCLPSTIKVQLETLLDGLEVQHRVYDNPDHNIVKWRRKVNSKFDDESGQWVPMPLRIETEDHALVFMDAEDMVQLALGDGLDEHMSSLRNQCPNAKLIYVLQGVVTWMRKNRNLRNRQFAAGVRSQTESQPASGRRRADSAEYVDEELVEDAILRLQVEHDVLIHHTAIPLETAQWISIFTQNISTIPYKRQKDEDTAGARFCMDNGQVKTGENAQDTYVRMLQEIFRVTAPIAYGVASEFDTVTKLVEGLQAQGPNALEGVRKSANKDGALSDRAIGQATSKRFYKIFTGTDETSTDV